MRKDQVNTGLRSWTRPEARRIAGGSAEENASTGNDGSGLS
ncbi:MAG TPA: hypothetical protein VF688_06300 [Allosphingosinicella sp.]|jgi:hypothetical protein